ncbi:imidazole glycerol phosphate synthase subunit HisF [Schleiferia thermophila]|jgi:cyclase|uniref:Imidazole glycerol phosphate synthase subunit HisF n=1 Tax=Schleiferia thermophila TaxID=884107 RepID=A0A369A6X9_9FLAO|nr:imidazole glycerol phosphate synthase subunit HisF [Schleiferia thermophila]KFD39524.1 imidazole glycerol phosphate synthase [Schleiferia thermophila str. Yellowstone]RCX05039.1 cyclase [Schleiferia thermophila]GCD79443.1 imidazole glycerol phosphate synthase cyclase subunit [Schleiferia thermophila]
MLTKRIIPCLDVKDGRTVKGTHFLHLRDAGDPVELASRYASEGADELVFLDITATLEGRKTLIELVYRVASCISIPFTVGGGIKSVADAAALLHHGADKISINTAALLNPDLITDMAKEFGSQCVVLAVDARQIAPYQWIAYLKGGTMATDIDAVQWIQEGVDRGAGEILLTSMNRDGTRAGFDIELTKKAASLVQVPIIASGGAGALHHFAEVFTIGQADAALAAGILHYENFTIQQIKEFLFQQKIPVRR